MPDSEIPSAFVLTDESDCVLVSTVTEATDVNVAATFLTVKCWSVAHVSCAAPPVKSVVARQSAWTVYCTEEEDVACATVQSVVAEAECVSDSGTPQLSACTVVSPTCRFRGPGAPAVAEPDVPPGPEDTFSVPPTPPLFAAPVAA